MKIKAFLSLSLVILLLTTGCSQTQTTAPSLENQIQELMKQNNYVYDTILSHEIKGDYIIVLSIGKGASYPLKLSILEYSYRELVWINGYRVSPPVTHISDGGSPVITIIQPRETNIKGVKVFGKPIKSVSYYKEITEEITIETKYWITFSEEPFTQTDIEYIID